MRISDWSSDVCSSDLAQPQKRATRARRINQFVQRRCIDHAKHRRIAIDQGDIDGELAIVLDELAGAVQWIDQPIALPVPTDIPIDGRGLLREHRDIGVERLQAGHDQRSAEHTSELQSLMRISYAVFSL